MSIDQIDPQRLTTLLGHTHPASVSLYICPPAPQHRGDRTPVAHDTEAARAALRSAANSARSELQELGVSRDDLAAIDAELRELEGDREFWGTPARSVVVFVSPEGRHAFRLRNELPCFSAVGDRFDLGPLLRATTFPHTGYVLAVTVGDVRLLALEADDRFEPVPLRTLPDDAADVFATAENEGQRDLPRADGALGQKVEYRRYCSIVQDAVLAEIGRDGRRPLILAANGDIAPAYREVNTYGRMLEARIDANPSSLDDAELARRARELLDEHYADRLADWRERFGTQRAQGRASSQVSEIAKAAVSGQVESLLFDLDDAQEGTIDEFGAVSVASEAGPTTYGLVDELAARVLRTGGTVAAVRRGDLPDADSPVAAIYRGAP